MEGNYVWNKWCEKKGYPKTIQELKEMRTARQQTYDNDRLDSLWEKQLQEFEEEELK